MKKVIKLDTASKRYAYALYAIAEKNNNIEQVKTEFSHIVEAFMAIPQWQSYAKNPTLDSKEKAKKFLEGVLLTNFAHFATPKLYLDRPKTKWAAQWTAHGFPCGSQDQAEILGHHILGDDPRTATQFVLMFSSETFCGDLSDGRMGVVEQCYNFLVGEGVFFEESEENCETNLRALVGQKSLLFGDCEEIHERSPACVVDHSVGLLGQEVDNRLRGVFLVEFAKSNDGGETHLRIGVFERSEDLEIHSLIEGGKTNTLDELIRGGIKPRLGINPSERPN